MRATGVVRKLDSLGRIVLPIALRRELDINTGDELEMLVDNDSILLKKYYPRCVFCGRTEGVEQYKEKDVCKVCMEDLKR